MQPTLSERANLMREARANYTWFVRAHEQFHKSLDALVVMAAQLQGERLRAWCAQINGLADDEQAVSTHT